MRQDGETAENVIRFHGWRHKVIVFIMLREIPGRIIGNGTGVSNRDSLITETVSIRLTLVVSVEATRAPAPDP